MNSLFRCCGSFQFLNTINKCMGFVTYVRTAQCHGIARQSFYLPVSSRGIEGIFRYMPYILL